MRGGILVGAMMGATVACLVAGSAPAMQSEPSVQIYEISGDDLPLYSIIEHFLADASMYYDDDADIYAEFCRAYAIDASWPSADRLGEAGRELEQEYRQRIKEAYMEGRVVEVDPNEWKPREIGRLFAGLHGQLRADGLTWNLDQFAKLIETKERPTFIINTDEADFATSAAVNAELFLEGVAEVSGEGAAFAAAGRER